jgi:nucleoside-diphosphate-sugar epimerase
VGKDPEKVLVTGAAGFVGRYVIQELADQGYSCVAPNRSALDLADEKAVQSFCAGKEFTAVVHLAARIPSVAANGLEEMIRQNMIATHNLLRASGRTGYFVYVSTLDVYGMTKASITEASPTDPMTPYGITKLAAEKLVQAHAEAAGILHCILRLSHVYGVGDRPIKLIPKTIERIFHGRPPVIFGDGSDLRDYIHVRDVARSVGAALKGRIRGVFNIAAGRSRSVLEVVRTILAVSESRLEIDFKARVAPRADLHFETTRARQQLSFFPQEDFEAGIKELCAEEWQQKSLR